MLEETIRIRQILARIAQEHLGDGSGNLHTEHIAEWIRSSTPADQGLIREVLLEDLRSALPERIDWIALGALADDASPSTAWDLEVTARSCKRGSLSRDAIVRELARMGHRPALDLYLEALDAPSLYSCDLLGSLFKIDRQVAVQRSAEYFVRELNATERHERIASNCAAGFLVGYSADYVAELAERTLHGSSEAGRKLVSAMLCHCEALFRFPRYASDHSLIEIHQKLQAMNSSIEGVEPDRAPAGCDEPARVSAPPGHDIE